MRCSYVRERQSRTDMNQQTLLSQTYVSVRSKTKSYRIQSGFLLLFIFLHQPSGLATKPCLQALPSGLVPTIPESSVTEYLVIHPDAGFSQATLLEDSDFTHTTLQQTGRLSGRIRAKRNALHNHLEDAPTRSSPHYSLE